MEATKKDGESVDTKWFKIGRIKVGIKFKKIKLPYFDQEVLLPVGVVFGDIGTSPLYVFLVALETSLLHSPEDVMGFVSTLVWLCFVPIVSIKFAGWLISLTHHGEGGTQALANMLNPIVKNRIGRFAITSLSIVAVSLFVDDGIITPAISVLGAYEGLAQASFVVSPVMIVILALITWSGLCAVQQYGTNRISRYFKPIMLVWFTTIAVLGIVQISVNPAILWSLSPLPMISYVARISMLQRLLLTGVVGLCATGGEALYADVSHFTFTGVRKAWFWVAKPALLLSYLGQGAWLMNNMGSHANPFFAIAPQLPFGLGVILLVIIATLATIIASQAMLTGVQVQFHQLIERNLWWKWKIIHTDQHNHGQIYVPTVVLLLWLGVSAVVVVFRSTAHLGHVYGLSVFGNAMISSILGLLVLLLVRKMQLWKAVGLASIAFFAEAVIFAGNVYKVYGTPSGAFAGILAGTVILMMGIYQLQQKMLKTTIPNLGTAGAMALADPEEEKEDEN